jgi:hypothetical protein
VYSIAD